MELQDTPPPVRLPLTCIGFKNVKKRIIVQGEEYPIALDAEIDACISINGERRGAHLSRNYTAIIETLHDINVGKSIEQYLYRIAESLLSRHQYATRATATLRTTYHTRISFYEISGVEPVQVEVSVELEREKKTPKWSVSVGLYGLSVCPSAQSTIKEKLGYNDLLAPSHSQKVFAKLVIEHGEDRIIRIEDLATVLARAFSAPAFSFLKRDKEAQLIIYAHRRPRFAEDIARYALLYAYNLLREKNFSRNTIIRVDVESIESIHPHNVYASLALSISEIEELLDRPDRYLDEQH